MFELEARAEPSRLMSWLSPLLAVMLMLGGGVLVFWALGKDPVEGFRVFFLNPLKDFYSLSELLLKATPLMLCAIGLAIGFRANVWNIGAEGQFMLGAAAATGVALYFDGSDSSLLLPVMIVAGALGGAAWAAIPALLRTRFNANEILVSLMLVYVAELFVSWLVFGPWKDPDGFNFPQTRMFGDAALMPVLLEGTRLHLGFAAWGVNRSGRRAAIPECVRETVRRPAISGCSATARHAGQRSGRRDSIRQADQPGPSGCSSEPFWLAGRPVCRVLQNRRSVKCAYPSLEGI